MNLFEFFKKLLGKVDGSSEENLRKRKADASIFDESSKKHCMDNRVKILKEVKKKSVMMDNTENLFPNVLTKKSSIPEANGFGMSKRPILAPFNESLFQTTVYRTHRLEEKQRYKEMLKKHESGTSKPSADSFLSHFSTLSQDYKFSFTFGKSTKSPKTNTLQKKYECRDVMKPDLVDNILKKYDKKLDDYKNQAEELSKITTVLAKTNQRTREITLEERLDKSMRLCEPVFDEKDLYKDVDLPELTPGMLQKIHIALSGYDEEVIANKFGLMVKRRDLKTLTGLNWLNDEVINFYMNLLIERGKEENYPNVYAMNTFFYPKLLSGGHASLKRWTRKIDIFAQDIVVVPIHLGIHWCMATINFQSKSVNYYDSMGSENHKCLSALRQYLEDEHLDKKKSRIDLNDWVFECAKNIPQQMNGSDCGVFSCMFAEFASTNRGFSFTQKDMPYFRNKMMYEIITMKLL